MNGFGSIPIYLAFIVADTPRCAYIQYHIGDATAFFQVVNRALGGGWNVVRAEICNGIKFSRMVKVQEMNKFLMNFPDN